MSQGKHKLLIKKMFIGTEKNEIISQENVVYRHVEKLNYVSRSHRHKEVPVTKGIIA